jgi:hypothetical protein
VDHKNLITITKILNAQGQGGESEYLKSGILEGAGIPSVVFMLLSTPGRTIGTFVFPVKDKTTWKQSGKGYHQQEKRKPFVKAGRHKRFFSNLRHISQSR